MAHSYNVYIDESGDDGIQNFRAPGSTGGASHWLVIGACIVRANRDLEMASIRDRIKNECRPKSQKRSIHFQEMNHSQRRRACQIIGGEPIGFSVVLGWKNTENAASFVKKNQLYFYLTRYLIERISWFCRDNRYRVREGDGRARVTFSRRGGMDYQGFRSYLHRLKEDDTSIHWPVIDIDAVEALDHSRIAALQIADCGTSAIAAAVERDQYGNVESAYLHEISGNIYRRNGNFLSYGLKFLPNFDEANLDAGQAASFAQFR